jgi:hypothetical protein
VLDLKRIRSAAGLGVKLLPLGMQGVLQPTVERRRPHLHAEISCSFTIGSSICRRVLKRSQHSWP